LNAFGSFAGRFAIPADAPLGDYSFTVQRKGTQYGIAGNSFLVAEFRKPEFQVDLAPERPSVVDGDRIEADTTASFFFGGPDARLDLVTVDTEGNPLPGQTVTVKVYDRDWVTTKEAVPGGGRRYQSVPKDTLLQTLSARSGADGKASVTFQPAKPGTIRAVAEVSDARGHTARAAAFLWISSAGTAGGFAIWQVTNDD